MAKLGLRQTKGNYQLRGVVSGVKKDSFYKEGTSQKGTPYRSVNFGVEYNQDATVYVNLMGNPEKNVYFYNKENKTTKEVPWDNRYKKQEDGFRLIGITTGLSKKINPDGNEVNDTQTLAKYDAVDEIRKNLTDGATVFVKGEIKYSTYNDSHRTQFNINQISLSKSPLDFSSEKFKPENKFKQEIVFMGIKPSEEVKGEYVVSAKAVNYNSIEDIELYIDEEHKNLANTFRKNLKPYSMIEVGGRIITETPTETVSTNDGWGEGIEMDKVKSKTILKLYINGADPTTIDTATYSEEIIDEAMAKMKAEQNANKDYSTTDNWGKKLDTDDYDGEEWD